MTEPLLFLVFAIAAFAVTAAGTWFGWEWHKIRSTPITIQSIEKYIETKFPDKWEAYRKGVFEGYEQGLRDGQEIPDESSRD